MSELPQIPYNLNANKKKNKGPDNLFAGVLIGLICPVVAVLVLYFLWGHGDFNSYITAFTDFHNSSRLNDASKVLSLSMIINLIPFYYFLNRKKYYTARGVIVSMFIYGIIVVLYKFVL